MFFAAKHFDPQLGIDAHTYLAPPGVWPTLHIGIVMDPFDYLPTIQVSPDNPIVKGLSAMDSAMQAGLDTIGQGTAAPEVPAPPGAPAGGGEMPASIPFPLGATVEVAGVRRANAGTGGVDFHILVGAPMPVIKAPGGPQFDDELFMGSRIVLADGEPFSRISVPVLACNIVGLVPPFRKKKAVKPLRLSLMLPTTFNVAIPPQVFVGGPPTISWGAMVQRGLFKALGRAYTRVARRVFKNMPPGFLKCQVLRAEPVDIRDGSVSVTHEDFHIPGRLPLSWTRVYASRDHGLAGHCGHGWQTPADVRLAAEADGLLSLQGPEEFALFPALPQAEGQQVLDVVDGARLMRQGTALVVRFKSGLRYHFEDALSPEGQLQAAAQPITRIEDACGNHWRFVRQGGDLVRIAESGVDGLPGRSIEVQSRGGYIESMALRDPATGQDHPLVRYRHADGDLLAAIDALGAAREFAYLQHRMARHTDRTGLSFHYAYDEQWRVVHAWGDGGLHDYRFAYNAALRQTEVTNSLGHLTVVKFDEAGLPLAEIDPLDGVTTFEYDDVGRTVGVSEPGSLRTSFSYDAYGNLLQVRYPDGSTIGCEYDGEGQLSAIIDPLGQRWQHACDARGLPVSQTDPLGAITRFEHDRHGQLVRHVTAHDAITQLAYDRHGLPSEMTDPLGQTSRFAYGVLGSLTMHVDPLGRETRYEYDAKGRLVRVTLPHGRQVRCEYDAEDQIVLHVSEDGTQSRLHYTGIGKVAQLVQPNGKTIRYDYDSEEQLVGITNQRGQRYALAYDALGRLVEEVDYWGQSMRYTYGASGYLQRRTDAMGHSVMFDTDAMGRVIGKCFGDPFNPGRQTRESFVYDKAGRLVEMRNPASHIRRRFDAIGRLIQEEQNGFSVHSRYDAMGQRIERRTSAGNIVKVSYDPRGQSSAVSINEQPSIRIARDALGRTVSEALGDRLQRQWRYDARGLPAAQCLRRVDHDPHEAPVFEVRYEFDPRGNLRRRSDSMLGEDRYDYDPMGHVMAHVDPLGRVERYIHDAAGDRLITHIRQSEMRRVMGGDALPQDSWLREGELNGASYMFDRAGNLCARTQRRSGQEPATLHLQWDANHRLRQSSWQGGDRDGWQTRYAYDAMGRRVCSSSTRPGGATRTTWYYWDGDVLLGEVAQQEETGSAPVAAARWNAGGTLLDSASERRRIFALKLQHPQVREYVYRPDAAFEPLALIDRQAFDKATARLATEGRPSFEGSVFLYHNDINGAPTRLTDFHGNMVWCARYTAWGHAVLPKAAWVDQPLRLQGQQFDEDTGLHYNRYRYFDPHAGQFIGQDSIGLLGGPNLYGFAPNTFRWVDPLGQKCTHTAKNAKEIFAVIKAKWGGTKWDDPPMDARAMREINAAIERVRARDTSAFPHKDGTPYSNSPKDMDPNHMTSPDPAQTLNASGSYKEYTVKTPGVSGRGARRVVVDYVNRTAYYSHDHYHSFIDVTDWVFR